MSQDNTAEYEGAALAYSTHAEGQRSAREEKHKADLEAQENTGLVSVEGSPVEEAKFVANPEGLRKEVDSEEKFSETLEDHPVDVEVGGDTVSDPVEGGKPDPEPAAAPAPTKAAAKKSTAKKVTAKK